MTNNQYPKVGIGIITCQNRPIHPNFLNLISGPTTTFVYTDHERKGPAYGRNECLKVLSEAGCDYFFLFDDDVYPVHEDWQSILVDLHESTGIHLFGYPDKRDKEPKSILGPIEFYQWNTGCFISLTRDMLEAIGYFNPAYKVYGFEDIAYLYRARRSGLAGNGLADPTPTQIYDLIYAEDILGVIDSEANMSVVQKTAAIDLNRDDFNREVASIQNYYPYPN